MSLGGLKVKNRLLVWYEVNFFVKVEVYAE